MDNCTKFSALVVRLRELLRSVPYSKSTVSDMNFILRTFSDYMEKNALDEYSPAIGEMLISYCKETLKVCSSRVCRANVIVSKLNRMYQGLDGEEALWGDKPISVNLPGIFLKALDSFITYCRSNGNRETTLRYKRWICSRFLKNAVNLGCPSPEKLDGGLIQAAFLQLGYSGYWEKIGPFLCYLFESGQIGRDFSKLIPRRKTYAPQPTVYSQKEISLIKSSVDRSTAVGIRNYAIVLLLSRYGIRSRDISALSFENLDFENNRIHFIQQKTGDPWEMDLFPEVKTALQEYILTVRPNVPKYQNVFLTTVLPYKPLSSGAINTTISMLTAKSAVDTSEKNTGAVRSGLPLRATW